MPDEFDVSFSESMTVAQRDALIARMRTAWNNLPPDTQDQLKPILDEGHAQLSDFLATGKPFSHDVHGVLRVKSYLTNDWDGHLAQIGHPLNAAAAQPLGEAIAPADIEIAVGPEGDLIGSGKYQALDPRWELVIATALFENILHPHPFPTGAPAIQQISDNATFVLAGDYGTGNFGSGDSASVKISKIVPTLNPDYTIHLGDVYYAGATDEETGKLLAYWYKGSQASFTLNSNHEMYSGASPYFNTALGSTTFKTPQSPWSFFALENSDWILVGLDSAYYSSPFKLYMQGTLGAAGNNQSQFLQQVAARNKKTIILTHHNPIPCAGLFDDPQPNDDGYQLYNDVMAAFAGHSAPAYWYYGHIHIGAAYNPLHNGMLCRCLGHGAIPAGASSDLANSGFVTWHEKCNADDPDDSLRIFNGFVQLTLNGPALTETFYDELGRVAWTPGKDDERCS